MPCPFLRCLAAFAVLVLGMGAASAETVYRRGLGPAPGTIDPGKAELIQEANIVYELFEGLFSLDGQARPRLALAEKHEISADGLTHTFHLRANAKWSDGTPVTAEDFVFSWRRLADPKMASPYAYFLWPLVNGEAVTEGKMPPAALGVEARDARTLVARLHKPTGYFQATLQHVATFPVQKANVEKFGADFTEPGKLVSSGAYMLKENVPQDHLTLVRNPAYYDAAQVKIDRLELFVTENIDSEFKRFRAGELDVTQTLPINQIKWAKENLAESYRATLTYSTYYYSFNLTREPWKSSPKLRAALSLAIDRDVIADKVIGGGEKAAFTWVPPGVAGYDPARPDWAGKTQAERDQVAKKLFAEAGYGPGGKPLPPFEVLYRTSENERRVMVAVAAMWKQKLGVETILNNQEFRVVASIANRKAYQDLVFYAWIGDYPDPNTFLSLNRSDVVQQNLAAYRNPAYDALMDQANATVDSGARHDLLRKAEATMNADFPIMTVFHNTRRRMVSPKVKGWTPNTLDFNLARWLELAP